MSTVVFDTDKKRLKNYINDVVFLYSRVQKPVLKKDETDKYQYTLQLVVDEDTADLMESTFSKIGIKKHNTAIFEEKFGVAPPYPDEKKQYVVKLNADSHYKDGTAVPYEYSSRPKVLVPVEGGVKDVTLDIMVGNGSKGDVSFSMKTYPQGTFAKLTALLVKDMIEYEGSDGSGSAFGTVTNVDAAKAKADAQTAAAAPVSNPVVDQAPAAEAQAEEKSPAVNDDNSPF